MHINILQTNLYYYIFQPKLTQLFIMDNKHIYIVDLSTSRLLTFLLNLLKRILF